MNKKMLSSVEAAEVIGLSSGTLVQWRYTQREGQPPYHKVGRLVKYRLSELEAWLDANTVATD